MSQYPIAAWHYRGINTSPEKLIDTWHDLGLNLVTVICSSSKKDLTLRALDRAQSYGMKLILMDSRTSFLTLHEQGEEIYRKKVQDALWDFGSHPALFGFYVGDEPDAPYADTACKAVRINQELAPHLTAFLNLLPWFPWIGKRMGTDAYAPYLDRICRESNARMIGYDCYAHMKSNEDGRGDYFNNLREHLLSYKRNGVPFISTVLCAGHFFYRRPSKDDLRWQLSTAVAHGASAVMWFHIELIPSEDNYHSAPINRHGDCTEDFGWLREVNLDFQNQMGQVMADLSIDECYHVGQAFGGMPLFKPFASILDVHAKEPLIISSFHNKEGERFYVICSNTPQSPTYVSLNTKENVSFEKCVWGNKFTPMPALHDAVGASMSKAGQSFGFFLNPGQMILLRETQKNDT